MTGFPGRVLAVGVLTFCAAYLALDIWLFMRVPGLSDWESAANIVRSMYQEGDCVVFQPPWAQEGAPFFHGMDVFTSESVDWYEVGKKKRVWVVVSIGTKNPRVPEGFVFEGQWQPGKVWVWLFRSSAQPRLIYDFKEHISEAKVTRIYRDRREECTLFQRQRWHCGSEHPWQFVGLLWRDIAGAVREVIWAHPLNNNNPIEIKYHDVPVGNILVVHYGWTQRAVEAGLGAPVNFRVEVAGQRVFEKRLELEETDWYVERIDVSSFRGRRVEVVFVVSTRDYQNRQFCFTADMWE